MLPHIRLGDDWVDISCTDIDGVLLVLVFLVEISGSDFGRVGIEDCWT
jgi:hypothetical protein